MKNKYEKLSLADTDKKKIFADMKNNFFSSDTIDALSRFYDIMCELNLRKTVTLDGEMSISENGVVFYLRDSDEEYHYCAESKKITKHSSEIIQIS
jgi:hypothetical protein